MKKYILIMVITVLMISCGKSGQIGNNEVSDKLIGIVIKYNYSKGNEYVVKFEKDGLSYQYRSGKTPELWWGKFQYNHMMTENGEHLISWFEPDYGDYVTLLIDFDQNIIYGSAIIKGETVHFQKGKIQNKKRFNK